MALHLRQALIHFPLPLQPSHLLPGNKVCTFPLWKVAITDGAETACHLPPVPAIGNPFVDLGRMLRKCYEIGFCVRFSKMLFSTPIGYCFFYYQAIIRCVLSRSGALLLLTVLK